MSYDSITLIMFYPMIFIINLCGGEMNILGTTRIRYNKEKYNLLQIVE